MSIWISRALRIDILPDQRHRSKSRAIRHLRGLGHRRDARSASFHPSEPTPCRATGQDPVAIRVLIASFIAFSMSLIWSASISLICSASTSSIRSSSAEPTRGRSVLEIVLDLLPDLPGRSQCVVAHATASSYVVASCLASGCCAHLRHEPRARGTRARSPVPSSGYWSA